MHFTNDYHGMFVRKQFHFQNETNWLQIGVLVSSCDSPPIFIFPSIAGHYQASIYVLRAALLQDKF